VLFETAQLNLPSEPPQTGAPAPALASPKAAVPLYQAFFSALWFLGRNQG
jgi:hypothetical protein